jgi:hypothetical protein
MSTETMKQALEALEEINKLSTGESAICLPAEIDSAMDALRQAIEQDTSAYQRGYMDGIAKGLRMEQAEQAQPVAWYDPEVMNEDRGISWTPGQFHTAPLYTVLPRQKQQGMTAEIERLKDALNKSESRLHEVAVLCEQVERDRDAALLALRQAEKQEPQQERNMSIEAMKQALEALENCVATCFDQYAHEQVMSRPEHFVNQTIKVLRQTIEQAEKQEPVAWMHNFITGNVIAHIPADIGRHPERWTALYKDPTPCQTCESLAMAVMNDQTYHDYVKRQWVGLTDDDLRQIILAELAHQAYKENT